MNRSKIAIILVLVIIGLIIFEGYIRMSRGQRIPADGKYVGSWGEVELRDVATGNVFRISDFKGKPVLLESFAVWCKTCLEQQRQISVLKSREGDAIVHISLDTDANEDEAKVRGHLDRYGFDWLFTVAPIEVTRALINDYGLNIVNAPAAPVIVICEDQSTKFLRDGVKSADELLTEVRMGCKDAG